MSDEPQPHTSKLGAILVFLAVGGSAIGVAGWQLLSNRSVDLDTSGFDMSTTPDPAAAPAHSPSQHSTPAPQTSLGMVKGDAGMRVVGPGASSEKKAQTAPGSAGKPANPKEEAALTFRGAAIRNEKAVDSFIRRMQKKHPSIARYGKDWAASPELRALRDQYWKEKDPMKFAYGLAKSKDFGKLVAKYRSDPGIRDVLISGIKEAPPSLLSAAGGVFQKDRIAKEVVTTVIKAVGLPASMTGFLNGNDAKMPDQNQIMSDIMNSAEVKNGMKNQPAPVSLDQKTVDEAKNAAPNGFTPLGGR